MENNALKALIGLASVLIAIGALLFLSAWSVDYWQAWNFLAVFGLSGLLITLYLMKKDPKLLERRIRGGPTSEKEPSQQIVQALTSAGFIAILVFSGLDHRFGRAAARRNLPIGGDALVLFGWLIIFFVFKQNSFASATIELAPEQKVISTGLYGLVRHPMYMGALCYLAGMPLALGSWWGLVPVVLIIPVLIWRLIDEENFLAKGLPGYVEYQSKVRHHLIPFVW